MAMTFRQMLEAWNEQIPASEQRSLLRRQLGRAFDTTKRVFKGEPILPAARRFVQESAVDAAGSAKSAYGKSMARATRGQIAMQNALERRFITTDPTSRIESTPLMADQPAAPGPVSQAMAAPVAQPSPVAQAAVQPAAPAGPVQQAMAAPAPRMVKDSITGKMVPALTQNELLPGQFAGITDKGVKYAGDTAPAGVPGGNRFASIAPGGQVRKQLYSDVFGNQQLPSTVDRGLIQSKNLYAGVLSGGSATLKAKQSEYGTAIKGMQDTRKENFALKSMERKAAAQAALIAAGEAGDMKGIDKATRELRKEELVRAKAIRGMNDMQVKDFDFKQTKTFKDYTPEQKTYHDQSVKWGSSEKDAIDQQIKDAKGDVESVLPGYGVFTPDGRIINNALNAFKKAEAAKVDKKGKRTGMPEAEIDKAIDRRARYEYLKTHNLW